MIESIKKLLALTAQELQNPLILKQKDQVFYLLLNSKANTFTQSFTRNIHTLLDVVQGNKGPTSLVTASLSKLYSGGMDLKQMSTLPAEDQQHCLMQAVKLFGRISLLPMPTFTLVRGGAVAGGGILALSHDFTYVGGNALIWINQSHLKIPFPPGALAVIKKRVNDPATLRDLALYSKKYSAEQAVKHRIIDGILNEDQAVNFIHQKAVQLSEFGNEKQTLRKIKCELYRDVVQGCFQRTNSHRTTGYLKMKEFPKY